MPKQADKNDVLPNVPEVESLNQTEDDILEEISRGENRRGRDLDDFSTSRKNVKLRATRPKKYD